MVNFLVLCHPHVGRAINWKFLPVDVIDPVTLLPGFGHLSVEPISVLDDILTLVSVIVKFVGPLGDLKSTVVQPLPEISFNLRRNKYF